jgi:cyclophilin family peptidyl-prolyl cis-trans isomerase
VQSLLFIVGIGICFLAGALPVMHAEDITPPIVAKPIGDVTVAAGAPPTVIGLKKTFALRGVTSDTIVRFTTSLGIADVELYPESTPKTVANFLDYVNKGEASNGGYGYSIIQRSMPGFVLQGGTYYIESGSIVVIPPRPAIKSEAGILNTTGTIAMALTTGPDTATSAWFFNLADNTQLDGTKDFGPFTVFGRLIENGMDTIKAIVALKRYDLSGSLGAAFQDVPVIDYTPADGGVAPTNLVYTESIATIPLTPAKEGAPAILKLKVTGNTNPDLVQTTISGRKLTLKYPEKGTAGTARITVMAKDAAGTKVHTSFLVTVE